MVEGAATVTLIDKDWAYLQERFPCTIVENSEDGRIVLQLWKWDGEKWFDPTKAEEVSSF